VPSYWETRSDKGEGQVLGKEFSGMSGILKCCCWSTPKETTTHKKEIEKKEKKEKEKMEWWVKE
jgi:hypothetical protein